MTRPSERTIQDFIEICIKAGVSEDKINSAIRHTMSGESIKEEYLDALKTLYPYL